MNELRKKGYILVFTLVVMDLALVLTGVALALVQFENLNVRRSYDTKQALNLAEAGVDQAIRQINSNASYAGETNISLGNGVFSTVVTGSSSNRVIVSTGYIPNLNAPRVKRTVKVDAVLSSDNVEFFYGIQVDSGGLNMANNSQVTGNVYSNGDIIGGNGSKITGDAIVAGGISDTPTIDQSINDVDQFFGTDNSNKDIAQVFISGQNDRLNKISVLINKVGSPGNLTLHLTSNSSDHPDSTDLASTTILASQVGTTPSWIDVSFASPPTLGAGAKFWIVLDSNDSSNTNYWNWRTGSTAGGTGNNGAYTSNWSAGGVSWTNIVGQTAYRVWIGGTATKIQGLTIGSNSSGTGRANQFVSTNIHGSNCPNQYCLVTNPPRAELPISDGVFQGWKSDAEAGGTLIGDYNLTSNSGSLGPKKIQGNLNVDNGAILTITGTVWVTGNITLSNNCSIVLDPGYSTESGVVVTEGTVTVSNNCQFSGAEPGSFILLATTRDAQTEDSMDISNNSIGVIYYASKTRLKFANNSTAREATAWGIDLSENANIVYDSGLANTNFTSGPGGGWRFKAGTWREIKL